MWLDGGRPVSADAAAGETVTFNCLTDAIPEPVNFWFINSVPIESECACADSRGARARLRGGLAP